MYIYTYHYIVGARPLEGRGVLCTSGVWGGVGWGGVGHVLTFM